MVCIETTLGALPGDDPILSMRPVDLIWGELDQVRIDGPDVKLGVVNALQCGAFPQAYLEDFLKPDAGHVDFMLFRETGQPDYGTSSGGLPRTPDSAVCP